MADTTKLKYTLVPGTVYYTRDSDNPSIALLSIGVSNGTRADITILGFELRVPVSNDVTKEDALTSQPSAITPISLQPMTWSFDQVDDGLYRALPIDGPGTLTPGQGITFQLQGVVVNEAAGTATIKIRENGGESGFGDAGRQVIKTKSKLEIKKFDADPVYSTSGDGVDLKWETEGAARVALAPGNFPDITPNDSVKVYPLLTSFYTLTAFGEGPNVSKQVTINIQAPNIVKFTASPSKVNAGDTITLEWEVEYSDDVSISPGDYKKLSPKGKLDNIVIWTETNFILTATNKGNEFKNKPAPVSIHPVEIVFFKAQPGYGARLGEPIALSWEVKSAVSASVEYSTINSIDQAQLKQGTINVVPNTGVAYSLIAQNSLGTVMRSIELLPTPVGWYKFTPGAPFKFPVAPVALKYKNKIWVMASGLMNSVYQSFDGLNWIPVTSRVPWDTLSYSAGVVFKDKMWVMGGLGSSGCINTVWSTTDGITWATGTAQWPARRSQGCFVLPGIDKIFITGGIDNAGNCLNDVWSSADGKQWTKETDQAFSLGRAAFGMVVFDNAAWVIAGLVNGDESKGKPTNDVWYSTNGVQWNNQTKKPNWEERYYPSAAGLTTGLYMCGGINELGKGLNDLNKMSPGQAWSGQISAPWVDIKNASGLEYQDALWCVGGGLQTGKVNTNVWAYSPSPVV